MKTSMLTTSPGLYFCTRSLLSSNWNPLHKYRLRLAALSAFIPPVAALKRLGIRRVVLPCVERRTIGAPQRPKIAAPGSRVAGLVATHGTGPLRRGDESEDGGREKTHLSTLEGCFAWGCYRVKVIKERVVIPDSAGVSHKRREEVLGPGMG